MCTCPLGKRLAVLVGVSLVSELRGGSVTPSCRRGWDRHRGGHFLDEETRAST